MTVETVGWPIRNATWPVFPEGKLLENKNDSITKSLWKMPQRVEIRKEGGFPQLLGKASQKQLGFPTFPTGPAAGTTKTNTKTKYTLIPIRGGCASKKKERSIRSGADGVVVQDKNVSVELEPPPRPLH